jgi:hypothetical protein
MVRFRKANECVGRGPGGPPYIKLPEQVGGRLVRAGPLVRFWKANEGVGRGPGKL